MFLACSGMCCLSEQDSPSCVLTCWVALKVSVQIALCRASTVSHQHALQGAMGAVLCPLKLLHSFSSCLNRLLQFQRIFPSSVGGLEVNHKESLEKNLKLCLSCSSEVLNVLAQPEVKRELFVSATSFHQVLITPRFSQLLCSLSDWTRSD